MVALRPVGYDRVMLRIHSISLLVSLLFLVACGGDTGTSDTGAPAMDAPVAREDAPGLDAPSARDDAFSADDAPVATDDAPVATDDVFRGVDDAFNPADAPVVTSDAPASGAFCGGIAGIACRDPREYCDESCTVPDAGGVCTVRPEFCTDELDPVCGCDGMDYGNPCMAAAAGVSIRSRGRCGSTPDCRTDGCSVPGQECCTGGRSAGRCYDPRCLSCCM